MKRGILKKWGWSLVVICSILLMIGCTDVSSESLGSAETIGDTQPPTITSKEITVDYGASLNYSDLVSVSDDSSDEIELSVVNSDISGITINKESKTIALGVLGTFEITVSAADSSGNTSEAKVSIVVEDHVQPVLSLSQTTFSLTAGDAAPNYANNASASDNADGDLTSSISVDSSKVNYNSPGIYEVTYKVLDSSGNVTVKTTTVTVAAKPKPASSNNTSSNNTSSGSNDSQVMITRTGECYHKRKCGNGNYFWVSLSEALSRGLRPCQKCY